MEPENTTFAPYPFVAAIFDGVEIDGIITVQGIGGTRDDEAIARAWAWFPEEWVITPFEAWRGVKCESAWVAPLRCSRRRHISIHS